MKSKLGKAMTLFLVIILLFGCTAKSKNTPKLNTPETTSKEVSFLEPSKLTEKESFYLNAFTSSNSLIAYDVKFKEDIQSLKYNLYKYMGNRWEKINNGTTALDTKEDAWIIVSENLSDFKICVKSENNTISRQTDPLKPLWEDGYIADSDIVQKYAIEKKKEFPVVAYRRFHVDDTSGREANLYDFQDTKNIRSDENDEYFMLTFIFE